MNRKKEFLSTVNRRDATTPELMCTTMDADRDGDRVFPYGGYLTNFLKNPVLFFSHQTQDLPIGRVEHVGRTDNGISIRWKWLDGDEFASRVRNAWEQQCLNASSIGFLVREAMPNEHGGMDITKWELLEVSLVGLPANPMAMRTLKDLDLLDVELSDREAMLTLREQQIKQQQPWPASHEIILELDEQSLNARGGRITRGLLQDIRESDGVRRHLLEADDTALELAEDENELIDLDDVQVPSAVFDVDLEQLPGCVVRAVGIALNEVVGEAIRAELFYQTGRVD